MICCPIPSMTRLSIASLFLCLFPLGAAQRVDLIVSADKVVTMDASRRVIDHGAVAVQGGKIVAVGPRAEIDRDYTAAKRIDRGDAILAPGLINTHTHAAMSLLRGIADDRKLQDWLEHFIFPAEAKNVSADFVKWGTRLAVLEMMLSGTTTYTDMYYFEDGVAQVTKAAGMRAVLGQTIIGFPAPDSKTPQQTLALTERFLEKWKNDPLIVPAVAPHAIYTNSAETLTAAAKLADKYGMPLVIHVSETKKENDDAAAQHHMTPTEWLESNHAIAKKTVFAHGVWMTAHDREIAKQHNVGIAHCPTSNLKLSSGVLPLVEFEKAGIAVGLGPDGPAGSNNDFDLLEEANLAALLAKGTTLDPQVIPAQTAFAMATIGGARAIHLGDRIGSLEVGKQADLITVATTAPHAIPHHDVYSMLVYDLKGSDVQDVVIDGKVTVEARKPLTLNPGEILSKAEQIRKQVEASLK